MYMIEFKTVVIKMLPEFSRTTHEQNNFNRRKYREGTKQKSWELKKINTVEGYNNELRREKGESKSRTGQWEFIQS